MNVLEEAAQLVASKRQETYGEPVKQFTDLAKVWSILLRCEVTAEQVILCMAALKLVRLAETPNFRDSQVDLCGYARLLEMVSEKATK